jgi:cobalt/nickel transport system ATP-binding protein
MENKIKIEVKNLKFSYEEQKYVLKNINLKIYENETVCIIGENGSGKTTLLLCIAGLLKYEGEVKIDGEIFNEDLRKKIGFLFENPDDALFMPRVFDDVAFGPRNFGFEEKKIKEIVKKSLEKVGLPGFEERVSHHLSFGEKKRIALASIISYSPEILLLDEPTLGLSPVSRENFINLIKKIRATKIIATHDLEMAVKIGDRTVLINEGEIKNEWRKDKERVLKIKNLI